MKYRIIIILFLVPLFSFAQRDDFRGDSVEVKRIALHVIPNLTLKNIKGNAIIYFSPKINNLSSIRFDLLRMKITSLSCLPQNCNYTYNDSLIFIQFASPLLKDSTYILNIDYNGVPMQDASAWGGWYWNGNYAFNLGVGFKSIPHNLGRAWFPCIDNFKVKQAFDITISCPQNLKAVSNGILLSKTDSGGYSTYSYHLPQPIPCYLASCNIGPYVFVNDTLKSSDGRTLITRIAAEAKDTLNVKTTFQKLKATVTHFESLFGAYPFDVVGYSLVPFSSGAMEHATNIGLPLFAVNGTFTYETLWAHELSHMWWGDNITCASAEEMWINEGWAAYCERLFTEHFYGVDAYQKSIDDNHKYCLQFAHIKDKGNYSLDNVPQDYTYGDHSYKKGCDMIHTLRKMQTGDSAFSLCCKKLQTEKRFTAVTTDTVLKYFTKSSCELNGANELFKNPYYISNKMESKANEISGGGTLKVKLATYILKYPNNTCLPVGFSGDGSSNFEVAFDTVNPQGIYFTPGDTNSVVIFDQYNKFSDANTSQTQPINATGTLNFDNEICNVNITQKYNAGFIYINRSWDYTGGTFISPGIQANTRGYWTLDGVNLDKLLGSVRFYYNGSVPVSYSGFEGVDLGFIVQSEDSLVLLYRNNYLSPWQVLSTAIKTTGNLTDKKGSFLVNEIKKGQYCIGQYNYLHAGIKVIEPNLSFSIVPNPANDLVTVIIPKEIGDARIEIINLDGQVILNQQSINEKNTINISQFTKGIYFIRVQNETRVLCKKIIIN